jgi:thioredoxin-dependent peroxiredoxin
MNTLQVGDALPEFTSIDQNENTLSSEDIIGKKSIVFFYPRANTPGCTVEACNLRDNYKALQDKGYQLFGVSADSPKKQKSFAEKYALPFLLIADEDKTVIHAFGVWGPKKFQGREYDGIHRTTFLIDEKGTIEKVIRKVKTKDHAAQILEED